MGEEKEISNLLNHRTSTTFFFLCCIHNTEFENLPCFSKTPKGNPPKAHRPQIPPHWLKVQPGWHFNKRLVALPSLGFLGQEVFNKIFDSYICVFFYIVSNHHEGVELTFDLLSSSRNFFTHLCCLGMTCIFLICISFYAKQRVQNELFL